MRPRNRIVRCSPPFCHPSNSLYIYTFEICDDPLDCLTRGSTACIDLGINQVFTEWSPDTYLRHSIGTAIVDRFVVAKRNEASEEKRWRRGGEVLLRYLARKLGGGSVN